MSERKEEVYSARLPAGKRTYFFDIRESAAGKRSLAITELEDIGENEFERHRVTIFPEDVLAFNEEIGKALRWIFEDAGSGGKTQHSARVQQSGGADGWTEEEQNALRKEYLRVGTRPAINELAALLHKKPSEVRAKLQDMQLL